MQLSGLWCYLLSGHQIRNLIRLKRKPDPDLCGILVIIDCRYDSCLIQDPRKCVLPVCQEQFPVSSKTDRFLLRPDLPQPDQELLKSRTGRIPGDRLQINRRPQRVVSAALLSFDPPFRSIVDGRVSRKCIEKGVQRFQMSLMQW